VNSDRQAAETYSLLITHHSSLFTIYYSRFTIYYFAPRQALEKTKMKNIPGTFKSLPFCLLAAAMSVAAMGALANTGHQTEAAPSGTLAVTGKVTVNGHPAASGVAFTSGSSANTAKGSSAVVSLGKLGRVEVLPRSTMKVGFSSTTISGWLYSGRASITKAKGVWANVSTRDVEIIADGTAAVEFTVDRECGDTLVSVGTGEVQLHANGKVSQIAAGSHSSVGTPKTGCVRTSAP
jgi:ferric-dicitrate binding protein FerR (iron transport regulator)